MKSSTKIIASVFLLSMVYATLRYVYFHDVPLEHIPVYVLNKALSMAGLLVLGLSRFVSEKPTRRSLGMGGLSMIVAHVPLSLALLRPAYFERFFLPDGSFAGHIESALLAGGLGLVFLFGLYTESVTHPLKDQKLPMLLPWYGRLVLLCGALHVLFMGYPTWLTPGDWYGHLPPITLVSFVGATVLLVVPRRTFKV